ncbi:hypothetical protein HDU79_000338, partial [Rhizoclosmatium sp. JEL0117]
NVFVPTMGTILNNLILANTSEEIELQSKIKILNGKSLNVDVSQYMTLRKQSSKVLYQILVSHVSN